MSLHQLLTPFDRPQLTGGERARELYQRELKKGVELGRKLGAYESRFGKLRTHVTDLCATLVLQGGFDPNSAGVLALRNTVRIMKGKNKL